ncbi:MAG: sulfite exporter TauE/SafE family protein [Alphaproteobacteria bacterium]|nr:sulfite exporter TauE/SafE family protein [Alphaproteobacteria bacterium]
MTAFLVAVSLAAIAGTPHCVGMCGGFATAASESGMLPYQVGRIGTYAALGALAGAAGRWIPGPSWVSTVVGGVLVVGMAASLAGLLPEPRFQIPGLRAFGRLLHGRSGPVAALALGVLNGLLPCGLLYGALALPVAAGDAASGAILMTVFGLWTAIPLLLAATGLRQLLQRTPSARRALAGVVLISGLAGLAMRLPTGEVSADGEPLCHTPP